MNWRAILDVVFPAQCAACNALGTGLCRACVPDDGPPIRLQPAAMPVAAYGWYEGALRVAVLALKDGRRDVAEALGERLAALIAPHFVLVPVPTTAKRERVRGFDGVAAVAERAARVAGARVVRALEQSSGDAQRGRTRSQRLAGQFRFRCVVPPAQTRVLLLDDVCTTGATLDDCARALAAAGVSVAGAVVAAATKATPRANPAAGSEPFPDRPHFSRARL